MIAFCYIAGRVGKTVKPTEWRALTGGLNKVFIFLFAEVQCDHPESTKDGFIEVSNFKGSYVYGSRATYHCNPGFILWGGCKREQTRGKRHVLKMQRCSKLCHGHSIWFDTFCCLVTKQGANRNEGSNKVFTTAVCLNLPLFHWPIVCREPF